MRPVTIKQLIVVAGACLIFALLLFARTKPIPSGKAILEKADAEDAMIENAILRASDSLPKGDQEKLKSWSALLKQGKKNQSTSFLDSLIVYWSQANNPAVSAWYAEKKAERTGTFADWFDAGKRYHSAARFAKEQDKMSAYNPAIRCLQHAYSKDSLNLQLKTELGVCFVEGSGDPMKGITLLRGVLEKDPQNLEAQFNLGLFSVKSGQYEKAIERFQKVIEIDPSYVEIYLFLANTYERMNNKEKAIEALEKYKSLVTDNMVKTEVQSYINNLKNN